MKAWTSAEIAGTCAYDYGHTWLRGARVFRVQGVGWTKDYCSSCALSRHQAPPDTGEIVELADHPTYPRPLKALAEKVRAQFDAKLAAAGKDSD